MEGGTELAATRPDRVYAKLAGDCFPRCTKALSAGLTSRRMQPGELVGGTVHTPLTRG